MRNLAVYRFVFLVALWALVYHSAVVSMVRVWSESKTYEHGMLIVPIVLWLVWRKRTALRLAPLTVSLAPIVLMIVPATLWMLGQAAEIALFEHLALVVSLQLVIWFALGSAKASTIAFPIFYLLFCVPFGDSFIPALQLITADLSVFFVQLSGIPIYREGLFLSIPNGMFEVAEACSGIRFLISSVALGFLFAYLNFTKAWKRVIFVSFCFIFPIIANGIRAYGIVMIGHFSNMTHAVGADHLVYGWFFFFIVILSIFFVATKFADPDAPNPIDWKLAKPKPFVAAQANLLTLVLAAMLSLQWLWLQKLALQPSSPIAPIALSSEFIQKTQSEWGVRFPNAEQSVLAVMPNSDNQIYIASTMVRFGGSDFISHSNKLYDIDAWTLVSQGSRREQNGNEVGIVNIVNSKGDNRQLAYWYCIDEYCSKNHSKIKLMESFYVVANKPAELKFTAILSQVGNQDELL